MKKILLFCMFFLVALCRDYVSAKTWQDVTGDLTDREFNCLAGSYDGSDAIYVGTSEGLYEIERNDTSWDQIFMCRGQYKGINHICLDTDNNIYIATKNGLYKSGDSGETWERLFSGIGEENHCTYVISVREKKEILYLGTIKGLFWTEDRGKTWKRSPGTLGNSKITSLVLTKVGDAENLFIVCNSELYKATKDLKDYKKVFGSDSLENSLEDFKENTIDRENTLENEPFFSISDITIKGDILYLSTTRGLFISRDGGISWLEFNSAGLTDRRINHLLVSDTDSKIFAATKNGVFQYVENEDEWRKIYRGMSSIDVRKLMVDRQKRSLWALCKTRIYKMDFSDSDASREVLETDRIFSRFKNEPTVNETMSMAIEYAEVYPDKIKKWRREAKLKSLFPKVSIGIDRVSSDTYEIYTSSSTTYWVYGPQDRSEGWDLNLSWDLSDLVWNESQTSIDVRSKLMVQLRDDIVNEVNRTYFERRRLQIELFMNPPSDLPTLLKKRLRIQELTASLDGLTGGRFSKAIEENN